MDLPTYTNIWRIEKRLYKLYDLRLPMPLPLVQIGVFVGIFVPWIVLLQVVGLPFHAPWHVVYLVPPGVLTWLATRPVIEGKRLTELLISQVRYLTEAHTWARLTPIHEPAEVVIVGRVWRRGHLSGGRVHAARPAAAASRRPAPQPVLPAVDEAAPAAPRAARPDSVPRPAHPAPPRRAAAPSLRATPHDGTATLPPAAAGGRGPEPGRPDRTGPERTRPERTRPERTRPERTRPERALPETGGPEVIRPGAATPVRVPGLPPTPGPAVSASPDLPGSSGSPPAARPPRVPSTRPEGPGHATPAAPGSPVAPAARAAGTAPSTTGDAGTGPRPEPGERPPGGAPRRATRPRSHEADGPVPGPRQAPSAPAAPAPTAGPAATAPGRPAPARPPGGITGPGPAGRGGPDGPGGPGGRHAAPPVNRPPAPDTPATGRGDASTPSPAAPAAGPSAPAGPKPPAGSPAGAPPSPAVPRPARPAADADRPGSTAAPGRPARAGSPGGPAPDDASRPAGGSEPGRPPAQALPFVQGRHARPPAGETPDDRRPAGERPAGERPAGAPAARPAAREPAAAATSGLGDDERRVAQARTDQIARPGAGRPGPAAPSGTGEDGAPGSAPGGRRGRSHGDEAPRREGRPPAAPARAAEPAAGWTPPAAPPRPAGPGVPPRPPAAPGRGTPAYGDPPQARPAAAARPVAPPRPAGARPARRPGGAEPAEPPASPARAVRSGPASPVRPGPMPQLTHDDESGPDTRGLRRIFSGGGHGDGDYEERVRTAFAGARRVVVLGCTGGAGQTVTALMLGHTFAQQRGDRIVAVDVNPGPGAMARRTRTETRETLTSLITHAEQVTGYQVMRRYTSISKSGLEVVAAGKNPVQALDDRDYALAMRTLDRFYSITLLDAAAAVVARVLPYADQIVLVAPASSDAPRAVAMTFEWLDGHGYEDLRARAVTVINGVSRRSMDDVEQAESVARGRCRALVRIPWDDHLSLDRAPRNELRSLRSPTRKAYIALGGVVAGGFVQVPERYPQQEVTR